jgi:DNA-binding transcriptional MerR regulator
VRIAELSRRSGVTAATIKYYLRERLLSPGVHTHPNQVEYSEHHVTRLRLIRAFIDVGGLSVSATAELLAVLDSPDIDAWESVGKVQYALSAPRANATVDADTSAVETVDALLDRRGWRVRPDSPARRLLIDVSATLHALGHDDFVAALDDYASTVEKVVAVDIGLIKDQPDVAAVIEKVIVGTVLGDTVISALRQLAQEHTSRPQLSKRPIKKKPPSRRTRQPAAARTPGARQG